MTKVGIIDPGTCNLHSIARAVQEVGGNPIILDSPEGSNEVNRLILPGVGAFGQAMQNLRARRLDVAIREEAAKGIPVLGVCLGMQLLMTKGTEGGDHAGLDLVPGEVRKLEPSIGERVPHVGWNEVHIERESSLLEEPADRADFYFVHSYHVVCEEPGDVVATTPYCGGFVSIIERDNIAGFQFHPEKSQAGGLRLLASFVAQRC